MVSRNWYFDACISYKNPAYFGENTRRRYPTWVWDKVVLQGQQLYQLESSIDPLITVALFSLTEGSQKVVYW
jgi:hypothetical protein